MRGILPLYILLLVGCARLPETCTIVFPRATYCIQGSEGIDAFSVLQQVEFKSNGSSGRYLIRLETDKTAFSMALLTMLGQNVGSVSYTGGGDLRIVMPGGEKYFDPLIPAAYVQLALWPKERVLKGFPSHTVEVKESTGRRTILRRSGAAVITIDYEGTAPMYDRLVMTSSEGHQVIITTLEKD